MTSSIRSLADRLRQQAAEDPKKAVALGILVTVMGGLWIRATAGGQPASAVASPAAAPVAAVAEVTEPGSTGARPVASADLRPWLAAPLRAVDRNLFRVAYDYYPRKPGSEQKSGDELAKSVGGEADVKREKQILIANLQVQAAQLKLQSTMMGQRPKAMVNGELVGEGDVVASFRVVKVEARGIIIEREGIRLEILMK